MYRWVLCLVVQLILLPVDGLAKEQGEKLIGKEWVEKGWEQRSFDIYTKDNDI